LPEFLRVTKEARKHCLFWLLVDILGLVGNLAITAYQVGVTPTGIRISQPFRS